VSTAYPAERPRRAGIAAGSRNAERMYRAAMRHSRLVRLLRLAVPIAIALSFMTIIGVNYLPSVGQLRLPGELSKLVISGTKIKMASPRLNGFTADSRPYSFTAESAAQDITRPDLMELERITASMQMEDKGKFNLSADSGIYDMKAETLTLHDNIHITSTAGYEARLSEALVDMHKSSVVSQKPVWVKLLNGDVNGKHLEITDSGAVIRFTGGVSMTLYPDQDSSKADEQ
jgi:lipopolysaccharide export system protein LptC